MGSDDPVVAALSGDPSARTADDWAALLPGYRDEIRSLCFRLFEDAGGRRGATIDAEVQVIADRFVAWMSGALSAAVRSAIENAFVQALAEEVGAAAPDPSPDVAPGDFYAEHARAVSAAGLLLFELAWPNPLAPGFYEDHHAD